MNRTIPTKESLRVEFKSDRSKLADRDIALVVVCLANTEGGDLYLGVEDDGTVTGLHPDRRDQYRLAASIANRTSPSIDVRVTVFEELGHLVARIEVPRSLAVVSTVDGQTQRRRLKHDGTPECVALLPAEAISRLGDLGQMDFSARPVPGATLDDLDPEERRRLREVHQRFQASSDPALRDLSDDDLDGALGFVDVVDGRRTPTVAGLLVIGRERAIARHLPSHEVMFQVFDGADLRVNDAWRGPLLRVFVAIEAHLRVRNEQNETQVGLFRVPIPTVDERGFREAVLNAFVHRDYARSGAIHVQWGADTIEVGNPGGFVEGVTLDNLLVTQPRARNRCLADALKRIGLVERSGRGVDLIFAGVLRYGRPSPDYSRSDRDSVTVVLSQGQADVAFLRMILEEEQRLGAPIAIPALIALAQIRKERRCPLAAITKAIQRGESEARGVVERLVEAGLVEARGERAGRVYILSERVYQLTDRTVGYQRQKGLELAEQEALVLRHVKKQGEVRRADVVRLCHLNDDQATRLLKRLVKSGKLVPEGSRRGTRYVRSG